MSTARISPARLHKTITELSKIGHQSTGGITRLTFSRADIQARKYVSNLIRKAGMSVSIDKFGNIIGRSLNAAYDAPTIACGSHIDTVPNGGALDGAYGVLGAIEAIRSIHEHYTPTQALQIMIFTEEEGARFGAFIGSRGFAGLLNQSTIYAMRDKENVTFQNAMGNANLKPSSQRFRHHPNIRAYVELHIEQGPILEHEHKSIGIVESIVGLGDLEIELEGKPGHAGTTPMRLRRDALVGAAKIILGINRIALKTGIPAVATVGSVAAYPGAPNVIPGRAMINVDYRDTTLPRMRQLEKRISSISKRVADENNLKIVIRQKSLTKPAKMSTKVIKIIETSSRSLGLSSKYMQSGAGHDCQNMTHITKTGMIFVPSRDGISHAPNEYTKPKQLEDGANVLLQTLLRLANE
ncbi:MAG: Zn-dependent hydrolase [Candidatus Bathyarchaeia archaeon]